MNTTINGALLAFALLIGATELAAASVGDARFEVSLGRSAASEPIAGRLLVVLSTRESPEPRFTIGLTGPVMLGVDLEQLSPGAFATIDANAASYPIASLRDLPAGDYFVQAVVIRYHQAKRADGHTVWVPTQHRRLASTPFFALPGNLYSKPQKLTLDPAAGFRTRLELTDVIPPAESLRDTQWLRHVRIKSKLLSDFWGTPVYLGASALLPRDYDKHPDVRYPTIYAQSQEAAAPFYFDPDPASHEQQLGLKDGNVQTGYEFYQSWIAADFPRCVVIVMEQSSPYFLEAYSVDSANNGPDGKAIT
ncbi:MAG: hypothetical protein ACREXP_06140, partial [Steroidobacteraceae bacterium]